MRAFGPAGQPAGELVGPAVPTSSPRGSPRSRVPPDRGGEGRLLSDVNLIAAIGSRRWA